VFDHQSRLWWICPDSHHVHRLVVSDPRSGTVLMTHPIEPSAYAYRFFLHHQEDAAILDAAAAQEGTSLWHVAVGPQGLTVQDLGTRDRIMGSFDPTGTRFVAAPHRTSQLTLHRWPDGAELDRLDEASIFLPRTAVEQEPTAASFDAFDYTASFVDRNHVIIDTGQRRLLLMTASPLALVAELWPQGYAITGSTSDERPGNEAQDGQEPEDYEGTLQHWACGHGQVLTALTGGRLALWDLGLNPHGT
jgi:hypothetical protein